MLAFVGHQDVVYVGKRCIPREIIAELPQFDVSSRYGAELRPRSLRNTAGDESPGVVCSNVMLDVSLSFRVFGSSFKNENFSMGILARFDVVLRWTGGQGSRHCNLKAQWLDFVDFSLF